MLKVLLLFGLIGFCFASTILSTDNRSSETEECLYENQIWGSDDPTKFYFCLDSTIVIEQSCPTNTFFIRNSTTSGCVPLELVESKCVTLQEVGACTGKNLQQPQPATNPTQFYLCPSLNATPLLLTCAEGMAFVKQDGYLGCFKWSQWRSLRDCPK